MRGPKYSTKRLAFPCERPAQGEEAIVEIALAIQK